MRPAAEADEFGRTVVDDDAIYHVERIGVAQYRTRAAQADGRAAGRIARILLHERTGQFAAQGFVEGRGAGRCQLPGADSGDGMAQLLSAGGRGKAGDDDFVQLQGIHGKLKNNGRRAVVLTDGAAGGLVSHKPRFEQDFRRWQRQEECKFAVGSSGCADGGANDANAGTRQRLAAFIGDRPCNGKLGKSRRGDAEPKKNCE